MEKRVIRQITVGAAMAQRLDEYCAEMGKTKSRVARDALEQYLDGEGAVLLQTQRSQRKQRQPK